MSVDKRVLAVCVNWNGRAVLPETLASLKENDYPLLDVVVVDNASTDGSLEGLPPSIRILALDKNLGYGGALNAAIRSVLSSPREQGGSMATKPLPAAERQRSTAYDYFLLLNNDIVLDPRCVSQLVQFSEEKGPAISGPKVLRYDKPEYLDAAWGHLNWGHVLARYRGKGALDGPRWSQPRRVNLLIGCALMVHRRIFEDVGLFDEKFFLYHEEVDFLHRSAQRGYPVYYCPFTQVRHRGAYALRSQPLQKVFWTRKNTVYFLKKHRAGLSKWAYFWLTLWASFIHNLVLFRWKRAGVICRGVVQGFKVIESPGSQK